jgi:pantoate--beta-alanine ligase
LPQDLEALSAQVVDKKIVDVVFSPNPHEMYPSGITQDVAEQKGAFIEVKGFSHQMEGKSRPTFFRGVATIVTKLFNIIQVLHHPIRVLIPVTHVIDSQRTLTLVKKTSNKP